MPRRRALVVGINEYEDEGNRLESCVNDARAFATALRSVYGFQEIAMLLDRDATSARLDAALSALFDRVEPDDRLVFYYSGHGHQVLAGENREEVLVMQDGSFFQDDRLSEKTQSLPAGVLTVVIDSCFAGGMVLMVTRPDGAPPEEIEMARTKRWRPPAEVIRIELEEVMMADRVVYKGFARAPVMSPSAPPARGLSVGPLAAAPRALDRLVDRAEDEGITPVPGEAGFGADEVGQTEINGVLLMASQEWQTASANTEETEGLSAFTYALLKTLGRGAWHLPPRYLVPEVTELLHAMDFFQTPSLFEPPMQPDLDARSFVLLQPVLPSQPAPIPPEAIDALLAALAAWTASTPPDGAAAPALNPALVQQLLAVLVAQGAGAAPPPSMTEEALVRWLLALLAFARLRG